VSLNEPVDEARGTELNTKSVKLLFAHLVKLLLLPWSRLNVNLSATRSDPPGLRMLVMLVLDDIDIGEDGLEDKSAAIEVDALDVDVPASRCPRRTGALRDRCGLSCAVVAVARLVVVTHTEESSIATHQLQTKKMAERVTLT
jgi:hypothetical protein